MIAERRRLGLCAILCTSASSADLVRRRFLQQLAGAIRWAEER